MRLLAQSNSSSTRFPVPIILVLTYFLSWIQLQWKNFTKKRSIFTCRKEKWLDNEKNNHFCRKKNKTKRKGKEKDFASNGSNQGDSGIEAVTTPSSIHDHSIRPSSTTSRESEADALTSGYFRYNHKKFWV